MITMSEPLEQIDQVEQQAMSELAAVTDARTLEQFRIKFLGSSGLVKNLTKLIGEAAKDQKRIVGQRVNETKSRTEAGF